MKVYSKRLQRKYWWRNFLWNKFFKDFLIKTIKNAAKEDPKYGALAYLSVIAIEFTVKYYYLKYGLNWLVESEDNWTTAFMNKEDIDPQDFMQYKVLRNKKRILKQLQKEAMEADLNY
jgi:hypothetical protein